MPRRVSAALDLILAVNNLGMWPDPPTSSSAYGADEVAALLADAGFDSIETRQLDLDPPMMLIIGTRTGPT